LGFFGIVLAFNTANNFAQGVYTTEGSLVIYTWTIIYFLMILIYCAAFPYLTAFAYLLYFHKEWVNTTRIKASEFLPCATTQVNYVDASELEYLTHPEKLADFDKPDLSDKPAGKAIIICLMIACIIFSFWAAFIF
jgi:hypothetical protein